ncbi:RagB/SusD family nutrient uptake outer membrane protein [Mucilaginibacter sp. RS28]|uniref:RagB/SusD family nutrient uptake outer membrane protein n=1 Tax=Mucilaginibacter straminoryzae TaxID=2932774 RepID=A0A9X1X2W3_9SPHI|nr:RagB/SusD family nutrient uptake outer membrane protein [Mucilaginibacter straminoryzae]MCJ8208990.1 RagB/SusD family nutrient uptake outer membrane protein [Mucilaginibacter straminoryzae]
MKLFKQLTLFVTFLSCMGIMSSCNKYLDVVPKGQQVIESTNDYYNMVALPNRGYPINNFQYLVDDMWIKESYVIGQPKSIDIVNFTFDEQFNRPDLLTASSFYNQCYSYINRWNMIITLVDGSNGDDPAKKVLAKSEARMLRAFDYFLLINVYAKSYDPSTAGTDGGVCIMDKYDLEATPKKSTVAEVYDFIQKDIDESIPNLQEKPVDPYHPSLAFAYALKAKVHLFRKQYAEAKAAALKSLSYNNQIFDLVKYTSQGGPTALPTTAANNPEVLSFMYMTGYNEMNFAYTYIISPELKQLFGSNDARFNLFFTTGPSSFLDAGSGTAFWNVPYTKFFYPTVGLKTTEVYLMLAECYAREGNLTEAMNIVNNLRSKRITQASQAQLAVPATTKATMDIIIQERRKELLFGFNRFFDLKRFNLEPDYAKTIVRKFPIVNTTVPQQTYTLQPNSRMYIIPFGQDVLRKNPSLTLNTNETIPFR